MGEGPTFVCTVHGPISRAACHSSLGGPLSCSYCEEIDNGNVRQVTTFAKAPFRRALEAWLAAAGFEQNDTDREGVQSWLAPDAGYGDGIESLTTLEAAAQLLDFERGGQHGE
jgi:hypothetical protein